VTTPRSRVVLVTGATSGIGLATARLLAQQQAQIVAVGHTQEALDTVAAELHDALAIRADMTQLDDIRALVGTALARLGRIDVVINNAARGYEGPVAAVDMEAYDYLYRLNVLGPLAIMRETIPHMRQAGGGRIINVCTPVARLTLPGLGLYASTKAALRTLTLTARAELARDGISVSLFYPFITSSSFGKNAFRSGTAESAAFGGNMPDADSPEFTASKLVQAIDSSESEISARPAWYFFYGVARKRLGNRPAHT
jgi:NAD(P)-dependent dehydrogenase (short-subunit alcohol dehydrogenase family)